MDQAFAWATLSTSNDHLVRPGKMLFSNPCKYMPLAAPYCLYYRYQQGRVDCDTFPYTTDVADYPSGIGYTDHVVSFFADQFGFNEQEATAIMGNY